MKMIHKMISILLAVVLLLSTTAMAMDISASDDLILTGMSTASVTQAVGRYFEARADYLLGNSTAMDWPVVGIVNDEAAHMAQYTAKGVILQETTYTVENIYCYDTNSQVEVTETITYTKDGITATEEILHSLRLYPNDANIPVVAADSYMEFCSDFESCSYLGLDMQLFSSTADPGSALCIVEIARAEIGTEETGTDMTKYGEWYGRNGVPWCAIFVSWCANQANVPTSIIPKKAGTDSMLAWFADRGNYYRSAAYSGTYTPQSGDIIFIGDEMDNPDHVGIVEKVANGKVWLIDGNSNEKVNNYSYKLTSSDIVGYGNPAYESNGHTFDGTLTAENHCGVCTVCGYATEAETHTFGTAYSCDDADHWHECTVCGYMTEAETHTFGTAYCCDETYHWRECTTCDYTAEKTIHLAGTTYSYDGMYHWLTCNICGAEKNKTEHVLILDSNGTQRCKMCDCLVFFSGELLKVNDDLEG